MEESSRPRCDPWCVSAQPSKRRYRLWVGLLVVLVLLVAVPVVSAARHYQQGLAGECALRFDADKTRLEDDRHHWDWWPPGWVCAFEEDGRRWERHLW